MNDYDWIVISRVALSEHRIGCAGKLPTLHTREGVFQLVYVRIQQIWFPMLKLTG